MGLSKKKKIVNTGRVVVLGTGWGSYSLLRQIDPRVHEVVVVSPRNHFVFTPLLASSAVGTLEHRCVIEPVRRLSRDIKFYQARCTSVDFSKRTLHCIPAVDDSLSPSASPIHANEPFDLTYDKLVLGCGSVSQTFGIHGVREHAFFLKEVADARAIRHRIIDCFERAQEPHMTEQDIRKLLHFCCVGGGPTSVELAGEMYDLIWDDLRRQYPTLADKARISLYEASNRILGGFHASLTEYAMKRFNRKGIEVRYGTPVSQVLANKLVLKSGEEVDFGLLVWSTGVAPAELTKSLDCAKDKNQRIIVDMNLRVLSSTSSQQPIPGVYAVGDCATIKDFALPQTAQVAAQQGIYLGKALTKMAKNTSADAIKPFKYHNLGIMAYLGGWEALYDPQFGGSNANSTSQKVHLSGRVAWLWWRSAYFTMTVSLRNKILIPVYWFVTWIFGRDTSSF